MADRLTDWLVDRINLSRPTYYAITLLRTLFVDFVYRGRTVTLLHYYRRSLWTLFIAAELLRYYTITDALCGLCLSRPNCYIITLLRTLFVDFVYRGRTVTLLHYYGRSLWTLFIAAEVLRYYGHSLRTLFITADLLRYYAITDALCGLCLSRPNCYTITLLRALFENFIYNGGTVTLLSSGALCRLYLSRPNWGEGGVFGVRERSMGGGKPGRLGREVAKRKGNR